MSVRTKKMNYSCFHYLNFCFISTAPSKKIYPWINETTCQVQLLQQHRVNIIMMICDQFASFFSRYSSSSFQTSSSRGYSSSSSNGHKISGIREENEDYTYQENRKHSGYSKYADGGLSVGMSGISLNGLRKPNIDSWDSMGILGLSSRMWSDTKKQQETFMTSTGQFLREENYNSHIMWEWIYEFSESVLKTNPNHQQKWSNTTKKFDTVWMCVCKSDFLSAWDVKILYMIEKLSKAWQFFFWRNWWN